MSAVPLTARQLEALIRLSQAYTRINLSNTVEVEHCVKAIELLEIYLEKIGLDPKTGKIDIDKITVGVTQSSRNEFRIIKNLIDDRKIEKKMLIKKANKKK